MKYAIVRAGTNELVETVEGKAAAYARAAELEAEAGPNPDDPTDEGGNFCLFAASEADFNEFSEGEP